MALYGSPCEEQGCLAAWLSDLDLCRNSPATLPMQLTAGWVKTWRFCRFRRWILTDKTGRWTQSAPVNLMFLICSPKKCSWKSLSPAMEWLYWLLEFVFGGDPAWRTSSRCWEWAFHSTGSVKLNKCWRSIKRVLYSQFTTPIPKCKFLETMQQTHIINV